MYSSINDNYMRNYHISMLIQELKLLKDDVENESLNINTNNSNVPLVIPSVPDYSTFKNRVASVNCNANTKFSSENKPPTVYPLESIQDPQSSKR